MIELFAHLIAWILADGTAAILAVISYLPPLSARIAIPLAFAAAALWWVRRVNRPVVRR